MVRPDRSDEARIVAQEEEGRTRGRGERPPRSWSGKERELCMYMSVCLSSERVSNGKGLCFPKLVVAPLVMPSFPSLLLYVLIVCSRGNERGEMERTEHGACVESKDGGERDCCLFALPSKYSLLRRQRKRINWPGCLSLVMQ